MSIQSALSGAVNQVISGSIAKTLKESAEREKEIAKKEKEEATVYQGHAGEVEAMGTADLKEDEKIQKKLEKSKEINDILKEYSETALAERNRTVSQEGYKSEKGNPIYDEGIKRREARKQFYADKIKALFEEGQSQAGANLDISRNQIKQNKSTIQNRRNKLKGGK